MAEPTEQPADQQNVGGATKLQLAALCIVVLASDITVTIIFPFGGYMVGDLVKPENPDDTGYYFGWLASAFMLGRAISVFPLSWASDRFGRKPFIYLGLVATFVLNIAFGVSPNFGYAVAMRVLCGFLNCIVAIVRTMVGEMCGEEQQAKALAYVNGMWSLGLVLGSAIGGYLAQPADKYESFANNEFLIKFPYFLPMFLPAVLCLIAFFFTLFAIPETRGRSFTNPTSSKAYHTMGLVEDGDNEMEPKDDAQPVGSDEEAPPRVSVENKNKVVRVSRDGKQDDEENVKDNRHINPIHVFTNVRLRDSLKTPKVVLAVSSDICISFVATAFDEILPLWAGSGVVHGGLGLKSNELGDILASGGVIFTVWQLFGAPRLQPKIDLFHSFRFCSTAACACMVGTPFFHYITKMQDDKMKFSMLGALVIVLTLRNAFVTWCMTVSSILINNSVPPNQRGSVNGLSQMLSGLARSIGPPLGTMLYAFTTRRAHLPYPLDFHFTFTLCGALFFAIGLFSASFPQELRHPAKDPNAETEEREAIEDE